MATPSSNPDPGSDDVQSQETETRQPVEFVDESSGSGGMDASFQMPERIGPYKIQAVIGQGGMGTVYKAVQESPRRTVALKVVKRGVVSRSARKRFEYEAQTLGRLRHENIAQIYEAGTHEGDGGNQPYFAMEYIPNVKPVTEYAKAKRLGTRERLALFSKVCEAIQHGHQKGIIHRDLKPGNILVTGRGVPKVIDFGVARSTDSDMALTTVHTEIGQLIGTLQYMSPEQCDADPEDIDTRSDVYALGLVLYELLTDAPAYDVGNAAIHEAVRVIREQEPARLSSINRSLRGDIETMTVKALQKNRALRYQSATEFGQDIDRYLRDEPISARPLGVIGKLRRSIRKHKVVAGSVAIILAVLMVSGITIMMYATEKAQQEREARMLEDFTTQVLKMAGYLQDRVSVGPEATVFQQERVKVLNSLEYKIENLFLGILEMTEDTLGEDHPNTIEALVNLAFLYSNQDQYQKSIDHYGRALEISRRLFGDQHAETIGCMTSIGLVLHSQGNYEESEKALRLALESARQIEDGAYPRVWQIIRHLSDVIKSQNRYPEATAHAMEAFEMARQHAGVDDIEVISLTENVSDLHRLQGDFDQAQSYLENALDARRRVHGNRSQYYLMALQEMIVFYQEWHAADPTTGHDAAASMYQAEYDRLR